MCVRIGKPPQIDISALRENYISPEFLEENMEADPMDQVPVQVKHYGMFFFFSFHYFIWLDDRRYKSVLNLFIDHISA